MSVTCLECDHPSHDGESCAYIPWDGNPYGLDCACPPEAERDDMDDQQFDFECCDHCGCGTPEGVWAHRHGHDDTCAHGCNDRQDAS